MSPSIHADAGRKGKAVEHLIAALCVLGSDGQLNAWTSLVDDEGVDLVLQRRGRAETLSLQVKSRLTTAKGIAQRQRFQSEVRAATLRTRPDLYMLFVVANPATLCASAPDLSTLGPGYLDLLARGGNSLWHRSFNGGTWGPWVDLGVPMASSPSAVSWSNTRTDVVHLNSSGNLIHTYWSP